MKIVNVTIELKNEKRKAEKSAPNGNFHFVQNDSPLLGYGTLVARSDNCQKEERKIPKKDRKGSEKGSLKIVCSFWEFERWRNGDCF